MTISVIMVSYHTGKILPIAVASVMAQEGLGELIIVDNGNPPDVVAHLLQISLQDSRLKIISGHGNIGFAAACNLGVKSATCEYLVMLNPNCILPPAALVTLVSELNKLPNTILAGPLLLSSDGKEQNACRRDILTPKSVLLYLINKLSFGFLFSNRSYKNFDTTHDVPAISGDCMCISKNEYDKLGGFDEGYFMHVEDLDLCIRINKSGKRIISVPSVKVTHLKSTSVLVSQRTIEKYKAQGFSRYFNTYFSNQLPGILPAIRAVIWLRYALFCLLDNNFLKWLINFINNENAAKISAAKLQIIAGSIIEHKYAEKLAGKTILVTGATSHVGLYVIRHLLASGAAVLAVSRDESMPFFHPYLKWLREDISNTEFSMNGFLADIAIHAAPIWLLPRIVNILADAEIKRIVAISSTSIFSKSISSNKHDRAIVNSLVHSEQELAITALRNKVSWTILRPTMIYGNGIDNNISAIVRLIKKFKFIMLYPPAIGRRQPVHAEDVALAALQAASCEAASGASYNISGGEILTYKAMIERIFATIKKPVHIVETSLLPSILSIIRLFTKSKNISAELAYRMNEDMVFFYDDAARDFSYNPRSFLSNGEEDLL